jgi:hypothetical protein
MRARRWNKFGLLLMVFGAVPACLLSRADSSCTNTQAVQEDKRCTQTPCQYTWYDWLAICVTNQNTSCHREGTQANGQCITYSGTCSNGVCINGVPTGRAVCTGPVYRTDSCPPPPPPYE